MPPRPRPARTLPRRPGEGKEKGKRRKEGKGRRRRGREGRRRRGSTSFTPFLHVVSFVPLAEV
jgi:hypothetical protein